MQVFYKDEVRSHIDYSFKQGGSTMKLGLRCPAVPIVQFQQQSDEQETRGQQSKASTAIPSEIKAAGADDCAQHHVAQPGTHHDEQPEIELGVSEPP